MIQPRRFHANFFFFIPLTQGVLVIIVLDFCKNAAFFGGELKNLPLMATTTTGAGVVVSKPKDPAYLLAQYVYTSWLILMMIKAVIGFRANLKFNIRWMGRYNLLFGIDTVFEFFHTVLGIIFSDMSALSDMDVVRRYCGGFSILLLQIYGFFCTWMHLKWVSAEMPHLLSPSLPTESLLGLMFPRAIAASPTGGNREPVMTEVQTTQENESAEENATAPQAREVVVEMPEVETTATPTSAAAAAAERAATATADTEAEVVPSEEPSPALLQPPSSIRSLTAMSAITLTPPTSYGSRSTPPTSFGSRTTADRSVYNSNTNPSAGEPAMEVIVER
ncbi:hypothetical protein EMPS_06464 [Entomortierella parvispora]|uniref:Uncharacterized protein n=1 Tax=Entomortierella parvispora TaxID=205924 RepID=A0A9P3HCB6_9FUNG|nr:hypothetical protein EMPS_06464 [Entomortierella parvispora]